MTLLIFVFLAVLIAGVPVFIALAGSSLLYTVTEGPKLPHLPLDGGRLRQRRCASPVGTNSRATARRAG